MADVHIMPRPGIGKVQHRTCFPALLHFFLKSVNLADFDIGFEQFRAIQ